MNRLIYYLPVAYILLTVNPLTSRAERPLLQQQPQQPQRRTITGVVTDETGETLPGAAIVVKGATRGVTTDEVGAYKIEAAPTETLEYSYLGYEPKTVKIASQTRIDVQLEPRRNELEEVTVVAFGKQKKESVVASITTINPSELQVPSSNLTQAFAGRIAGIISYQRTGEPGLDKDNAEFFIRGVTTFGTGKKDPLILIDNVEMTSADLARLTVDDIASFSIMKDANSTALYGARGANGVVLVTTKEGREGKVKIQFRAEGSFSQNTEDVKLADPVTYMKLHNQAVATRNPLGIQPYTEEKIAKTELGYDPIVYPTVDWMDALIAPYTFNQRYNLNVSGGGNVARYYIAASYIDENGIIKVDKRNSFNNNININRYVLRSNINVNLTSSTEAIVRLHGAFDDYNGPLDEGSGMYTKIINANPVYFLPYYPSDGTKAMDKANHILFGNYPNTTLVNPYAETLRGYKNNQRSSMLAQFELKQDLGRLIDGLSANALFNVNRYAQFEMKNSYKPFYYWAQPSITPGQRFTLVALNPDSGTDYLESSGVSRSITSTMYFEAALRYSHEFDELHSVSGTLVYTMRDYMDGNSSDFQSLMPHRNLGLAGRLTYGYSGKYFVEANFGYNGSERFAEKYRMGFFPSIGVGWMVSNENFWQPLLPLFSKLKLRATYGLVGNDNIGNSSERFFYLSNVTMGDAARGYVFGYDFTYWRNGISIKRYSNPDVTWEISRKMNLAAEIGLWNALEIQAEYFTENRSNILQQRADIPVTMGLQQIPYANIGKAAGHGVDVSVDFNKSFNRDTWASMRGNFTYATSKYTEYEEPNYNNANTPWRSHTNRKLSQPFGYIAERLFLDDEEVKNSPDQFENYMAGDIKYRDINGDSKIDENDEVPIGYPTTPEIIYGFGFSTGYKAFDVSIFFQGSARSSFFISANKTAPFVTGDVSGFTTTRAMLKYWADDHWSETDRDILAIWPRLSQTHITNNEKQSTWWMRDGSFLRLKTAELGWSLPEGWTKALKFSNVRLYLSGSNLLLFSKFKMWDVEMAGNGLAYPIQRVFNIGINADF